MCVYLYNTGTCAGRRVAADTEAACTHSEKVLWMLSFGSKCVWALTSENLTSVNVLGCMAGVLLWELFHCSTPYADTRLDQMAICKQVSLCVGLFLRLR